MGEIWLPIVGYEGQYEVSSFGRVKSLQRIIINPHPGRSTKKERLKKERILVHCISLYPRVVLCKSGKKVVRNVHRLVAEAFIANSSKKAQVNHKDGNKLNPNVNNLEWCTPSENQKHAHRTGLRHTTESFKESGRRLSLLRRKPILMYDINGNFVKEFISKKEAEEQTGCHPDNVLSGRDKHTKGFTFRYV